MLATQGRITEQNNNGNITVEGTTAQPASIATDGVYIVRGIMYTGDNRPGRYMDMMRSAWRDGSKTQSALERGVGVKKLLILIVLFSAPALSAIQWRLQANY